MFEIAEAANENVYSDEDRLWLQHHHAHILQMTRNFAEAHDRFDDALRSHERVFTNPKPEQVLERATIVHALADVYRQVEPARLDESAAFYRRALDMYNTVPEGFEQRRVDVKFSLGLLSDAAGDVAAASALYDDAKRLNQALHVEDPAPYGKFLTQLGEAHRTYGRYGDALTTLEEARGVFDGVDMPDDCAGIVSLEIADCLAQTGRPSEAEASYSQAISELEQFAGSEHANFAHALHRQARFWLDRNTRASEARDQIERAVLTLSETMGEQHDWTRQAQADLASAGSAS